MNISIAERFKPYSHSPGTFTLLPGSRFPFQVFPSLIRIFRFDGSLPRLFTDLNFTIKGPLEQFTILNDLEKGCLTISGKGSEGWLRIHFIASQDQQNIRLLVERAPSDELQIDHEGKSVRLHKNESYDLIEQTSPFIPYQIPQCDRLSFGCHKAQDWDLIKRRLSLDEIFPFWHRFGQLIPHTQAPKISAGTLTLLEECKHHFVLGRPEAAERTWKNLFLCGFTGILFPQLEDTLYQGIVEPISHHNKEDSPLLILSEGARLIREFLIQQERGTLSILPFLLPCLPFGRLVNVPLEGGGSISIEWSKKIIRRMSIVSDQDNEIDLKFRSNISSYRIRSHTKDKGEQRPRGSIFHLKKDCQYFIDHFR